MTTGVLKICLNQDFVPDLMSFYVLLNAVNIGKDDNVAKCRVKMSGAMQACRHLILLVVLNDPESGVTDFHYNGETVDCVNCNHCSVYYSAGLRGVCQHLLNCCSLFLLLTFFTDRLLKFVLCW